MQEANAFYFIQVHASCCKKDTWEVENSKLPEYHQGRTGEVPYKDLYVKWKYHSDK